MTENSTGAISLDEAVERMMATAETDDEAAEIETTEETGDSESEEVETGAEAEEDVQGDSDPEYEIETAEGKRRVKLSELLESPMLKGDYTRKTQAVAAERRALEASKAETAQLRQQLDEALKHWAVPTDPEPDWSDMAQKLTPQEFNVRRVQWEQRQRQKAEARAAFQAMQERDYAVRVEDERSKLLDLYPEWKAPEKFREDAVKMAQDAKFYGFSEEEIGGLIDHRQVRVLRDALAYRALQNAKPAIEKKVANAKPVLQPGAKPSQREDIDAARQQQRAKLKKSGDLRDAAALLLQR